jgi:hypothetical protein
MLAIVRSRDFAFWLLSSMHYPSRSSERRDLALSQTAAAHEGSGIRDMHGAQRVGGGARHATGASKATRSGWFITLLILRLLARE